MCLLITHMGDFFISIFICCAVEYRNDFFSHCHIINTPFRLEKYISIVFFNSTIFKCDQYRFITMLDNFFYQSFHMNPAVKSQVCGLSCSNTLCLQFGKTQVFQCQTIPSANRRGESVFMVEFAMSFQLFMFYS
ncbi:hypothetical protein D3C87_1609370 [compost metagenome]